MKMRELVSRTGVAKETIHFYAREGMLPPVEKPHPNQAVYNEGHVERILFIKKLQEKLFLPIPLIKRIIQCQRESPVNAELLKTMSDYFVPQDHFMPGPLAGVKTFLEYTGMGAERLSDFERYGIITSEAKGRGRRFSRDAVRVGKLIGDMRRLGLSYEKGFRREGLREIRDRLVPAVEHMAGLFEEGIGGRGYSDEAIHQLATATTELVPLYIYYMSRILLKRALAPRIRPNGSRTAE